MPDPVRSPSLLQCCSAAAGLIRGRCGPGGRSAIHSQRQRRGAAEPRRNRRRHGAAPSATLGADRRDRRGHLLARAHRQRHDVVRPHSSGSDVHRRSRDLRGRRRTGDRPAARSTARGGAPPSDAIPTVTGLAQLLDVPPVDFALPTHAHWDHVCGLLDFPGLPVHLHRAEHEWVSSGPVAPVGGVRDSLRDRPLVAYDLDGPPVLTFTRSHDLFGDNSVILVDLHGHTPGSVGVLAHTAAGMDPHRRRCRLAPAANRECAAEVRLPRRSRRRGPRRDLQDAATAPPGAAYGDGHSDP